MIRKYHNHKPQATPWHREEEVTVKKQPEKFVFKNNCQWGIFDLSFVQIEEYQYMYCVSHLDILILDLKALITPALL